VRAAKLADKYKGGNVDIPGVATLTAEKPLFNMETGAPMMRDSTFGTSIASSGISSGSNITTSTNSSTTSSIAGSYDGSEVSSQDHRNDSDSSCNYHVLFHKTLEVDVGLSWELAVEKQHMLATQLEEEDKAMHGDGKSSTQLEAVFFIRRSPSAAHGRAQPSLAILPKTKPKNGDVKIRGEPGCTSAIWSEFSS